MTTQTTPDLRASLVAALTAGGFDVSAVELELARQALEVPLLVVRLPLSTASGAEVSVVAADSGGERGDQLVQGLAQAAADHLGSLIDGDASIEAAPDLGVVAAGFRTPVQAAVVRDGGAVVGAVLCGVDRRSGGEPFAGGPAGAAGTSAGLAGPFGSASGAGSAGSAGTAAGAAGGSFAPPAGAADPYAAHGGGPFALGAGNHPGLQLLRDVRLDVSVELGRAELTVSEVLELGVGSVVELDRAARAPVDVRVNGTLLARGEVVVVDDEYAVRITEIVDPAAGGEA